MPPSRIVVMGASAGGIEAVSTAIAGLPRNAELTVLVVVHTGAGENSLAPLFARVSPLPVSPARDRGLLKPGHVYVAISNRHLLVEGDRMRVVNGPRQHGFRPAVDALFISAAREHGQSVAGVVLSGALSDGVAGLRAIKRAGGRAIVQNPEQAAFPSMPLSALREVEVDAVLGAEEIGEDLKRWAAQGPRIPREHARRPLPAWRRRSGNGDNPRPAHDTGGGHDPKAEHALIPVSCPSCGGALAETRELGTPQYECHIGHRFNSDSLAAALDEQTEEVLWSAVRALQEKALLRRRMHAGATRRTLATLSERWLEEAREAERQAESIRSLAERMPLPAYNAIGEEDALQARRGDARRAPARRRRAGAGKARKSGRARTGKQVDGD